MEAGLLGFVLDVYLSGPLVVEQHLPEYEFQVILVHVVARTCNLVVAEVCQIERRAVAVATLRNGVDVSAALQLAYILLCTQDRCHTEPVMRQVVAPQYIRPLVAYCVQFALGGWYEIWHGVCQFVHNVVVTCLYLHQLLAHLRCVRAVLRRALQTYTARHGVLLLLQVVELLFVIESTSGIGNHVVFHYLLLMLFSSVTAFAATAIRSYYQHDYCYQIVYIFHLSRCLAFFGFSLFIYWILTIDCIAIVR